MTTRLLAPAAWAMGLALVLGAHPCAAQTQPPANPTPGLPPVTMNAPQESHPTPEQTLAPAATAAQVSEAERSAALLRLIEEGLPKVGASAPKVEPPPAQMTVEPGKSVRIPIALGVLNRIQTPFPDPVAKHGEGISVERDGAVLYVASNNTTPEALFINQRGDESHALVLTVAPASGLDPVSITLHMPGYEPSRPTASAQQAGTFESAQPYVDTIKALFKELANGHIPQGYGLTAVKGSTPWMPLCRMPGVSIQAKQVLEGAGVVAVVARAVNAGIDTTELNEAACAAPGVLAVAAWPSARLEPGQETELYVAVRRPTDAGASPRPSTLRAGG